MHKDLLCNTVIVRGMVKGIKLHVYISAAYYVFFKTKEYSKFVSRLENSYARGIMNNLASSVER